jgi:hypothetical protein
VILCCSQSGDHPQEDFNQFWLQPKYEKNNLETSFSYFWLPASTMYKSQPNSGSWKSGNVTTSDSFPQNILNFAKNNSQKILERICRPLSFGCQSG